MAVTAEATMVAAASMVMVPIVAIICCTVVIRWNSTDVWCLERLPTSHSLCVRVVSAVAIRTITTHFNTRGHADVVAIARAV